MSASGREEAQRQRAEARRRRRAEPEDQSQPQPEPRASPNGVDDTHGGADPHSGESLLSTAKVAAAGAAVGAAIGAARALTGRGDEDEAGSEHEAGEAQPSDDDDRGGREAAAPAEDAVADQRADGDGSAERADEASPVEDVAAAQDERDGVEETPDEKARDEEARDEGTRVEGTSPDETMEVVRRAREQLTALQGREPESISSLERTPSGWTAAFEVVELERVPDSTDVLASYEVVLDESKNITRYARVRRYYRSQADREGGA